MNIDFEVLIANASRVVFAEIKRKYINKSYTTIIGMYKLSMMGYHEAINQLRIMNDISPVEYDITDYPMCEEILLMLKALEKD